jgi:hypothetical protein
LFSLDDGATSFLDYLFKSEFCFVGAASPVDVTILDLIFFVGAASLF